MVNHRVKTIGSSRIPRGRRFVYRLWSLAPLLTLGLLTFAVTGHAARRLRSRAAAAAAVFYFATLAIPFVGSSVDPDGASAAWNTAGYGYIMSTWLVGTFHSIALWGKVLAREQEQIHTPHAARAFPDTTATDPAEPSARRRTLAANNDAVDAARLRRELRERSRQLAIEDPALSRELGIGRPDLNCDYDDGGLIDINHAPEMVIASLPGISPQAAKNVVETRERNGAFISAEDVAAATGLDPQLTTQLADYTIYLP